MTSQTPVVRNHLRRLFPVIVAVQAGESFHPHAMNHSVSVAFCACLLIRPEPVKVAEVAFPTADVLHKNMPRMTIGIAQAP